MRNHSVSWLRILGILKVFQVMVLLFGSECHIGLYWLTSSGDPWVSPCEKWIFWIGGLNSSDFLVFEFHYHFLCVSLVPVQVICDLLCIVYMSGRIQEQSKLLWLSFLQFCLVLFLEILRICYMKKLLILVFNYYSSLILGRDKRPEIPSFWHSIL